MNKYLLATLCLVSTNLMAGTISRTYSYTDGNTITANENNTNENTLYNEINGNLDTANFEDGGIATADLADGAITLAKTATTLQSSFTFLNNLTAYRRPVIKWISVTTVDVEANTGTSNETCLIFPDQRRCVTEDTSSTSVNRRFIMTEAASLSGTKNSGLRSGYVETNNTWYSIYGVKATDDSTSFIIAADTITPTQAHYAALNSFYGTNGWVYLGLIRNGDSSQVNADILKFSQVGNYTEFRNAMQTAVFGASSKTPGALYATTAGAIASTFTYTAGFGSTSIPEQIITGVLTFTHASLSNGAIVIYNVDRSLVYHVIPIGDNDESSMFNLTMPIAEGAVITNNISESNAEDIALRGFYDYVLGGGINPNL